MTGAILAGHLVRHGLPADEAESKSALFGSALTGFAALSPSRPTHAWWIPGRLEVFGKHTDYGGGRSLVAALPRGFAFVAAPRHERRVHVVDAATGTRHRVGEPPTTGWQQYVDVAVARLARNFPGGQPGADIAFASDLPPASGLSSSSALVVGIATVLCRLWELEARPEWRLQIRHRSDLAMYFACIENGMTFGSLTGDGGVGTLSGSEDQTAMLLARPGIVSEYSYTPLRHLADAEVPGTWQFVVASSGVAAEKTRGARDAYNRLSAGVAALLQVWNTGRPQSPSLASALASNATAGLELRQELGQARVPGWTEQQLLDRLAHFELEDGLVPQATRAIAAGDRAALGDLSLLSQRGAEQLLRNQVPETIALAQLARTCGAIAASSCGAGFGGSVWALVGRADAAAFAADWIARYRANPPSAVVPTAFLADLSPAVVELTE